MTERINPDTGVNEEMGLLGWREKTNDSGNAERVNPDTGVSEERGLFGWRENSNESGIAERVNLNTGVSEERGLFGWREKSNDSGNAERVNRGTGVVEERGLFWWREKTNDQGNAERVNRGTGVVEERGLFWWRHKPDRVDRSHQGKKEGHGAAAPAPAASTVGGYASDTSASGYRDTDLAKRGWSTTVKFGITAAFLIPAMLVGFVLLRTPLDSPVGSVAKLGFSSKIEKLGP